jgi:hypothetical protein
VDYALGVRARRKQEENKAREGEIKNDQAQFALRREKVYLAVELIVVALLLVIAVASFIAGQHGIAGVALGGGVGLSGLVAVLHRPAKPSAS